MAYEPIYPLEEFHPHSGSAMSKPVFQKPYPYASETSLGATTEYAPHTSFNLAQPYIPGNSYNATGKKWHPGFWQRFPLLGVIALLGATACVIASILVLVLSDNKDINSWGYSVTPAVYLSITSVIGNVLLAFALTKGIVISFWRTALRSCTLPELHHVWDSGSSFTGAVLGTFRPRAIVTAIACLLTTISVIRSPLNQTATSVRSNVQYPLNGTFQVELASQLPSGYAGINVATKAQSWNTARLTSNFTEVMKGYSQHSSMAIGHSDCGEKCQATVKAFGFRVNCSISSAENYKGLTTGEGVEIFKTEAVLSPLTGGDNPKAAFPAKLTLRANYSMGNAVSATSGKNIGIRFNMTLHECDLYGGISSYKISLSNGTVNFQSSSWEDDTFLEEVQLISPYSYTGGNTIIGGFQYAAQFLFGSTATLTGTGVQSSTDLVGATANQYFSNMSSQLATFSDPMDDMINAMREIAFRASLRAARDNPTSSNSTQSVAFQGYDTHAIYVTDYKYMVGAAVVSILGILAVALTFYGWWELGRDFSISPLEILNAFCAPLLQNVGSNEEEKHILEQVGNETIRYGEAVSHEQVGRKTGSILAVQRVNTVIYPRSEVLY